MGATKPLPPSHANPDAAKLPPDSWEGDPYAETRVSVARCLLRLLRVIHPTIPKPLNV